MASFKVRTSENNKSWTQILVEESDYSLRQRNARRDYSFRRWYSSVIILFSALFLVYCSLFYVGAFIDVGNIVGISQSQRAEDAKKNASSLPTTLPDTPYNKIKEKFAVNRIYLRANQSILATYSLPAGTELQLKIQQCESLPVIEVFQCRFVGQQATKVRNKTAGFVKFTVTQPGFYYFEDLVIKTPNTELKPSQDYQVIWLRG